MPAFRYLSQSAVQGERYMSHWGFKNSYYFIKNLTERLVAASHCASVPISIVRPAIVGAVAMAPVPGYIGNSSGATGFILAYGSGQLWLEAWCNITSNLRGYIEFVPFNHHDVTHDHCWANDELLCMQCTCCTWHVDACTSDLQYWSHWWLHFVGFGHWASKHVPLAFCCRPFQPMCWCRHSVGNCTQTNISSCPSACWCGGWHDPFDSCKHSSACSR